MRACWCFAHLVGWSEGVIPAHDTMIAYHRRAKMSIFFFSYRERHVDGVREVPVPHRCKARAIQMSGHGDLALQ